MKLNKLFFGLTIVAAALFSSCDKDNVGAIYSNQSNAGLSFTASTMAAAEVPASNPVFDVKIVRGNTVGAASGNISASLKVGADELPGVTVSGYNFADGENTATVSVNVSPLEVGVIGTLTLTIADADASIGAVKTTTMKVSKAYEWKSLGKGTYVDNWLGYQSSVEILKAEGYDRYRVMGPYKEYVTSSQAADDWGSSWLAPSTSANFAELWLKDGVIYYDDFPIGINYEADKDQPIYVCHPSGWSSLSSANNKFVDDKTIQLAPYYYIDGLGGWNYTKYNGVIYVVLP